MNAVIGTIFVTVVHLTNGHTSYAAINAHAPQLCLDAASKGNTQFQVFGWQSDPATQRAAIMIRQQWNTDIQSVEFTCMSESNYNQLKDTQESKYWHPIEN